MNLEQMMSAFRQAQMARTDINDAAKQWNINNYASQIGYGAAAPTAAPPQVYYAPPTYAPPTYASPGATRVAPTPAPTPAPTSRPVSVINGVLDDGQGVELSQIQGLYNSLLGRDSDAGGLGYWNSRNDLTLDQLRQEFMNSEEYRGIKGLTPAAPTQAVTPTPTPAPTQAATPAPTPAPTQAPNTGIAALVTAATTGIGNPVYMDNPAQLDTQIRALEGRIAANDPDDQDRTSLQQELDGLLARREAIAAVPEEYKDKDARKQAVTEAIRNGEDLSQYMNGTYSDQENFLSLLDLGPGQSRGSKDETSIMPASPTGYAGDWKFDPVFGSDYYKQPLLDLGATLGMSEQQVRQAAGEYALKHLYGSKADKQFIGDNGAADFVKGLTTAVAKAGGVTDPNALKAYQTSAEQLGNKVSSALYSVSRSGPASAIADFISQPESLAILSLGTAGALGAAGAGGGALSSATTGSLAIPGIAGLVAPAVGTAALTGAGIGAVSGLPDGVKGVLTNAVKGGVLAGAGATLIQGVTDFFKVDPNAAVAVEKDPSLLDKAINYVRETGRDAIDGLTEFFNGEASSSVVPNGPSGSESSFLDASNVTNPTANPTLPGFAGSGGSDLLNSTIANTAPTLLPGLQANGPSGSESSFLDASNVTAPTSDPALPGFTGSGGSDLLNSTITNAPPTLPPRFESNGPSGSEAEFLDASNVTNPTSDPSLPGFSGSGGVDALDSAIGGVGAAGAAGAVDKVVDKVKDVLGKDGEGKSKAGILALIAAAVAAMKDKQEPAAPPPDYSKVDFGKTVQATNPSGAGPQTNYGASEDYGGYGVRRGPLAPVYTEAADFLKSIDTPDFYKGYAAGGIVGLAQGRHVQGPGDGMSDDVPAIIDGQEPARLATDEYVIPAQAVSALGNGSTTAGIKQLDQMVNRIYQAQTGKPKQMKPMNVGKVLPT